MSTMNKVVSVFSLALVIVLLGAAVQSNGKMEGKSKAAPMMDGSLASFGVKKGSKLVILDSANHAGRATDMVFTVTAVYGWHVKASLPGKMKFKGKNQFVLNLEDVAFQVLNSK